MPFLMLPNVAVYHSPYYALKSFMNIIIESFMNIIIESFMNIIIESFMIR